MWRVACRSASRLPQVRFQPLSTTLSLSRSKPRHAFALTSTSSAIVPDSHHPQPPVEVPEDSTEHGERYGIPLTPAARTRSPAEMAEYLERKMDCIVKVYTMKSHPYYRQPWQNNVSKEITGSGFVIEGRRILTNAHCVADQKYVMVRRLGSPLKYRATVRSVGHECDLAVLNVDDPGFWDGLGDENFLEFGETPHMEDEVTVVGYPIGGDNVSVTQGVVSRVEPQQYAHASAISLLAVQIDAAINPGNSGGPAFQGDKVIGVAFQNLQGASNIGFIIPVPIINHFLKDVEMHGKYVGFVSLGILCQATDNKYLQHHYKMADRTGVVVNKVTELTPAHNVIKKNDVIVAIDDRPIACDGSVSFRGRERISFDYVLSQKYAGDTCKLTVLRDAETLTLTVPLQPVKPLVPIFLYDEVAPFYIYAGLVFIPLSQPYLQEHGKHWYNNAPRELTELAMTGTKTKEGEQAVILSQVLMDEVNVGYHNMCDTQVKKVNGIDLLNLSHLAYVIEQSVAQGREFITLDMSDSRVIVINTAAAKAAEAAILERNRIPYDRAGLEPLPASFLDSQASSAGNVAATTSTPQSSATAR